MILSDKDIRARLARGDLKVSELADPALQIQPASIDLRLADEFLVYKPAQVACLDPREKLRKSRFSRANGHRFDG